MMSSTTGVVKEKWTRLKLEECSHVFTVSKYYLCNDDAESFKSTHAFTTNVPITLRWMWKLRGNRNPFKRNTDTPQEISVYLYLMSWRVLQDDDEHYYHPANISFSIIHDRTGKVLTKVETPHIFDGDDNSNFALSHFYKTKDLENNKDILPDDELKILCEYSYLDQREIKGSRAEITSEQMECTHSLLQDFGSLQYDPKFSDVTLCAGETQFPSHRNILSARSQVFKAMFECDMMEKNQNKVEIKDIKPEVLKEMLEFIYTGKTPNLEEMAQDLLVTADRYNLIQLKTLAEGNLAGKLCVTTATDQLIFADTYSATRLKKEATDFIVANIDRIRKTKGWRRMVKKKPRLMDQVLGSGVCHRNQK